MESPATESLSQWQSRGACTPASCLARPLLEVDTKCCRCRHQATRFVDHRGQKSMERRASPPSVAFLRPLMSFSQCLRWRAKSPASFSMCSFRALEVAMKVLSLMFQLCFICDRPRTPLVITVSSNSWFVTVPASACPLVFKAYLRIPIDALRPLPACSRSRHQQVVTATHPFLHAPPTGTHPARRPASPPPGPPCHACLPLCGLTPCAAAPIAMYPLVVRTRIPPFPCDSLICLHAAVRVESQQNLLWR